jgi:tRNA threonylcarbamoyladenosine biosynthesis protein TsaE
MHVVSQSRFRAGTMDGKAASPEEMQALGRDASSRLRAGSVIGLVGGLGAGKTHWTKGLVAGLGCDAEVTSPTFGLVHEYEGPGLTVFHLDFYRLNSATELTALGWDETLDAMGVVVVEWADKFPEMMPEDTRWLVFEILADGVRVVRQVPGVPKLGS